MSNQKGELVVDARTLGSTVVLSACGEVDVITAPKLSAAIAEAVATNPAVLVIDLTGVGFIGSAGLSVLVAAWESGMNPRMKVVASRQVRRPMEVIGLDTVLDVYETVAQALGSD
ncbi:STAS domain-containing protein [Nocardia sp. NPDC058058]|uniref:STAS domain-containing protein n=1 Tax=Nocardia sp. NPDC058058 TaxID=3346317 RepID=UPI0036DB6C83